MMTEQTTGHKPRDRRETAVAETAPRASGLKSGRESPTLAGL